MKPFLIFIALMPLLVQAQRTPSRVQGSTYPLSAVPDRLYLTSENYSPSEKVALQTLMGVIARVKPEILRDLSGHRGLVEKAGVSIDDTYYTNFPGLLAHFSNRLRGYILCNAKDRSTNVAISLAGIMNAVAIPADIEQSAVNAGLTRLLDVRDKNETWAWPITTLPSAAALLLTSKVLTTVLASWQTTALTQKHSSSGMIRTPVRWPPACTTA